MVAPKHGESLATQERTLRTENMEERLLFGLKKEYVQSEE